MMHFEAVFNPANQSEYQYLLLYQGAGHKNLFVSTVALQQAIAQYLGKVFKKYKTVDRIFLHDFSQPAGLYFVKLSRHGALGGGSVSLTSHKAGPANDLTRPAHVVNNFAGFTQM